MPNKEQVYLIQMAPGQSFYLDGYNGGNDWEWTWNIKVAWRLTKTGAEAKLERIKKILPEAFLVEVRR